MKSSLLLLALFYTASGLAAEPGYTINDILTANSATTSRSTNWKPGQGTEPFPLLFLEWTREA